MLAEKPAAQKASSREKAAALTALGQEAQRLNLLGLEQLLGQGGHVPGAARRLPGDVVAGDPPGPWWVVVQRQLGPLYLERVGLDVPLLVNVQPAQVTCTE